MTIWPAVERSALDIYIGSRIIFGYDGKRFAFGIFWIKVDLYLAEYRTGNLITRIAGAYLRYPAVFFGGWPTSFLL